MKKLLFATAIFFALESLSFAKVVATVNGKNITDEEIMFLFASSGRPYKSYDAIPEDGKKFAIDKAVESLLLTEQAKKEGIEKNKEYAENLTKMKDNLALQVWMSEKLKGVKIGSDEAQKFYNDNKERFNQPELAKASHVLVKEEAEAKAVIEELSKADKNNLKEAFAKLAKEKSIDKAANQRGGDLGEFDRKTMVAEFSDAAFVMEKGTISKEPVKTQFGYHVIYLEDKKPESIVSFDKVKKNIEEGLKREKFADEIQKVAKGLREKAKVEIK